MFGVEARKSVTAVVLVFLSVLHVEVLSDDVGGRQRLDVSKLPKVANPGERLLDAYREVRQHVGERYAEQKPTSKDLLCGSPANVGYVISSAKFLRSTSYDGFRRDKELR